MTMLTQQSIASVPTPPPGHLSYQVFQQWGVDVMKGVGGPGRVFYVTVEFDIFPPFLARETHFT